MKKSELEARIERLEDRNRELQRQLNGIKTYEAPRRLTVSDLAGDVWQRIRSKPYRGGEATVYDVLWEVLMMAGGPWPREEVKDVLGLNEPPN